MELKDRELDHFIAAHLMQDQGTPYYTASITEAWRVVEKMIRQYHCELKLDVFLGLAGERWVASFYSPGQCRRYEAQAGSAPLAICRAARAAFEHQNR